MKKNFIEPSVKIEEYSCDVITTSGDYPGYQRVIDSLATQSLNSDAEIVDWFEEQ